MRKSVKKSGSKNEGGEISISDMVSGLDNESKRSLAWLDRICFRFGSCRKEVNLVLTICGLAIFGACSSSPVSYGY